MKGTIQQDKIGKYFSNKWSIQNRCLQQRKFSKLTCNVNLLILLFSFIYLRDPFQYIDALCVSLTVLRMDAFSPFHSSHTFTYEKDRIVIEKLVTLYILNTNHTGFISVCMHTTWCNTNGLKRCFKLHQGAISIFRLVFHI